MEKFTEKSPSASLTIILSMSSIFFFRVGKIAKTIVERDEIEISGLVSHVYALAVVSTSEKLTLGSDLFFIMLYTQFNDGRGVI